jgi:6-phosphogluconolactonase (cycloisomerase 2 family)
LSLPNSEFLLLAALEAVARERVPAATTKEESMKHLPALAVLLATATACLVAAQAAYTDDGQAARPGAVVFVQTNEPTGNRIVVYDRAADGHLTAAGSYATGGNGGVALPGTESDHLASQGSLVYDPAHGLLLAVNAGSDSISAFTVHGDRLGLEDVLPSGGEFPASIAVHDELVYVLNAGGTGIVQGFRITGGGLRPIPHSARTLGLANTDPPNFLTSPGQVGFTPDGRQLIVTTKASGSTIDVFRVGPNGRLSETAVRNPSATPVPFAFTFTPAGRLAMGEAGASAVTTYVVGGDGTLADPKTLSDNQVALCWIQQVGPFYYVSNTGSDTLSGYRISTDGQPTLVTPTGVVATTEPGPIDLTSPSGTTFLYAETGGGTVDEFEVNDDGTLTKLGVVDGLPPGIEGIAST